MFVPAYKYMQPNKIKILKNKQQQKHLIKF